MPDFLVGNGIQHLEALLDRLHHACLGYLPSKRVTIGALLAPSDPPPP